MNPPLRYELLLNRRPGDALSPQAVFAALAVHHPVLGHDASRSWQWDKAALPAETVLEEGAPIAVCVAIGLGEEATFVEDVVRCLAQIATEQNLNLFDAQLGDAVTALDGSRVSGRYAEMAKYAGAMMGLPEALPAAFPTPHERFSANTKVLLAAAAVLLVLALLLT
ncbi:MAG: hypothetical protein ACKVPX_13220 [Myxococcaceae bacterium]